jgi:hypothetical protein
VAIASVLLAIAGLGYAAAQTMTAPRQLEVAPVDPLLQQQATAPAPVEETAPVEPAAPAGPARVDPAWVADVSARAGIPAPAVRAYANAQLGKPVGCEVGWTTLAGIGWIESQHGTLDGRILGDDGRASTPILGPALDGDPYAAIRATAETSAWHGDPTWDHAVGPMQFIPSTWEQWGPTATPTASQTPMTSTTPRPPRSPTCAPTATTSPRGPAGRTRSSATTTTTPTSPRCTRPRPSTPPAPAEGTGRAAAES